MTTTNAQRFVVVLGIAGLTGCVSKTAGLDDVRDALSTRTPNRVHWQSADAVDVEAAQTELLSRPLDGDRAARLAVLASPKVQQALDMMGIARAELVSAITLPNPQIDLGLTWFGDEIRPELGVSVSLADLVLMPLSHATQETELEAASVETADVILSVERDARIGLVRAEANEERLGLEKTIATSVQAASVVAAELVRAGNVPELVGLEHRVLGEEAKIALSIAEVSARQSRLELGTTLGIPDAGALKLNPRLPDVPATEIDLSGLEDRAVKSNLALLAAGHRSKRHKRAKDEALARGLLGGLSAGVGLELEEGTLGVGPRASLGLPIFDHNQGEIAMEDALLRQNRARATGLELSLRAKAGALRARLTAARERALFMKGTLLPLRAELLNETLKQYNAMNASVTQLVLAKRKSVETARSYVSILEEYWTTRILVEQLLRGGSVEGVDLGTSTPLAESGGAPAGGH